MVQEVSAKSQKTLKTYYYEKGFTYGRDGLFELLKKKQPKSHPSKEEIELWLKQQKIAQLYAQTRKGGVTDTFKPTKPWYQMSMDLIDFTNKPGRPRRQPVEERAQDSRTPGPHRAVAHRQHRPL